MRPDRAALRALRHPLVVLPLIAALLAFGWLQYVSGRISFSQPDPGENLLPAAEVAAQDPAGGWQVHHDGEAAVSMTTGPGHVSDSALRTEVSRHVSGDVMLTSPRVEVASREKHLFKAYYTSDAPFTLLARYSRPDGTDRLVELRDYPASSDSWTTVSDAFDSADTTTAVQYVFRLQATGILDVDGAYLVPAQDVYVPPAPPAGPNLIPNPELTPNEAGVPEPWSTYQYGTATVDFRQLGDSRGNYLETRISGYQDGEAKWQYPPIPVQADQNLRFTATYRSDREVDVVAEFETADGGRTFRNLDTVRPTGEWTTITEHVAVPHGATTLLLTLISHGNGVTGVRDHALVDVGQPGLPHWDRPLVSITFDDGWKSVVDNAMPLLDQYGFRATCYVNSAAIETPGFMTAGELQAMHRVGHDIAVHSDEHVDLTAVSTETLDRQLRVGQEALAEAGLASSHLAVPHGRTDAQVEWYARRYFQTLRGTETGVNTRHNFDPYHLRAFYVDGETTPAEIAELLAEARQENGWLILVYHRIAPVRSDGMSHITITGDALASHLELIRASGIAVEPVSRAFTEIQAS